MFRRRLKISSIDRLERECNDDFHLLSELGPEYFGIEHLVELREQARERLLLFDRRQRLAMTIGGTSGGWVLLALISTVLQLRWLSIAAYALTTLTVFLFLGLIVYQKWRFDSRGELEYTLLMIEEEIRKRTTKKTA